MTTPIAGFITVRTASSRLPQKCLRAFGDCNVLQHDIRRAKHYGLRPIVCTTEEPEDDVVADIATGEGVECFRGSAINKMKRWYDCCLNFGLDHFHTIDADDPYFDGEAMKQSMNMLDHGEGVDVVKPTYYSDHGAAVVGYSIRTSALELALESIAEDTDTEMVMSFLDKVEGLRVLEMPDEGNDSQRPNVRLTLDYEEDFLLLDVVRRLLGGNDNRDAVEQLFMDNPDLRMINWFRNEEWKANQVTKITQAGS